MSQLSDLITRTSERGERSLGMFVTSGFPTLEATPDLLKAIDAGGADFIELGMPFSDPLAEGLPIQRSSERALKNGVTMQATLAFAKEFTAQSDTPLLLMGYGNPVMRYGISNFFRDARSSGVQGVILPDVLPAEDSPFFLAAKEHDVDLVCLISPTTPPARMTLIDSMSSGFVYAVSVTGITGADTGDASPILSYLREAKATIRKNPVLVGFGIRSAADVRKLSENTDGAIVGSALINHIDTLWNDASLAAADRLSSVETFVRALKAGTLAA